MLPLRRFGRWSMIAGGICLAGATLAAVGQAPSASPPAASPPIVVLPAVRAEVLRVIDGDTLEVRALLWPDLALTTRVRIAGIDAPEVRGGCAEERARALAARAALAERAGAVVLLADIRRDKYAGRVVARVYTPAGLDLAEVLVREGHAQATRTRARWC